MARRSTASKTPPRPPGRVAFDRLHIWQIQAVRDLLWVTAALGLVWFGYAMRAVTIPLLVALLLAYLFEPVVARLSAQRRLNRPVVVSTLLLTVGVAVVALVSLVTPAIVRQTGDLISAYQAGEFRATAIDIAEELPQQWRGPAKQLIDILPTAPPDTVAGPDGDGAVSAGGDAASTEEDRLRQIVREEIALAGQASGAAGADRSTRWLGLARGGAQVVAGLIGRIIELGFLAFLIPFYFWFFSVSYPKVTSFCSSLVPDRNRSRTFELLGRMDRVVAGFVRGRVVIALIMAAMLAVGWQAFGVPHSIVLGLVIGAFCAVPYLGAVGIPLAVGLLAFKELGEPIEERMSWLWILAGPTGVFAIVQVIEGYMLSPLIAGKATRLDPVTIVVAVIAGGSIMGIYGMLLAIPVAACLKIFITDVLLPRVRAWTSGEAADPLPFGGGK